MKCLPQVLAVTTVISCVVGSAEDGLREIKPGETLVVSEVGAKLMRGKEVLAELQKGTEITVIQVKGAWIGAHVKVDGKTRTGWLRVGQATRRVKESPPGPALHTPPKTKGDACPPLVVPDKWRENGSATWSKCAQRAVNVSPLGALFGIKEGDIIGRPYWGDEKKACQGIYTTLKGGHHGIQRVHWIRSVLPGSPPQPFPPHFDVTYYTFDNPVYSAHEITIDGRTWPGATEVYTVEHKWMRAEEKKTEGRTCCRVDPVAVGVTDLGRALGYANGERVGPSYWAELKPEWRSRDLRSCAANPVACYESE